MTLINHPHAFAVGDIAAWSGIKRAGAALAMGKVAAVNLYSTLLSREKPDRTLELTEFPEVPPMMALAVGTQAISYGPTQGVLSGEDQMELLFQGDLGWESTIKYLGLTELDDETSAR